MRELYRLALLTAAFVVVVMLTLPLLAQTATPVPAPTTVVTVPYGAWISQAAETVIAVLMALVVWGARFLPEQVVAILKTARAEQLLQRAITYAVNTTVEAAHDKVLTFDVANAVVARAVNYATAHGAPAVVEWLGGDAKIRDKIVARLKVDDNTALRTGG